MGLSSLSESITERKMKDLMTPLLTAGTEHVPACITFAQHQSLEKDGGERKNLPSAWLWIALCNKNAE